MKSDYRKNKLFYHKDGKIYFSKNLERNIFFVCTVAILLWGVIVKVITYLE